MLLEDKAPGVYIAEVDGGSRPIQPARTAVAAFLGITKTQPKDYKRGEARLIANWTQFQNEFGGFVDGAYLPMAVYGYFQNGGATCYVQSMLAADQAQTDDSSAAEPVREAPQLPGKRIPIGAGLEAEALLNDTLTIDIKHVEGSDDQFTVEVRSTSGKPESFPNLSLSKGKGIDNVVEVVNRKSKLIRLRELEAPASPDERRPPAHEYQLAPSPQEQPAALVAAAPQAQQTALSNATFKGDLAERTGLEGLGVIDEITLVCVPDLMSPLVNLQADMIASVQRAVIEHCGVTNRFAILDSPPDTSPTRIKTWREETNYDSKYAALYYPWIYVANPLTNGGGPSQIKIPPSGHIAGMYARVDAERGVHKAPANEQLRGVERLEVQVAQSEQTYLNPLGINCIRNFPGYGIRVWGARTLVSKTDQTWRYVNVRRLFSWIEKSIYQSTQWVVFEPNDVDLWERVKRTITAFLTDVWRSGALFGLSPDQAFYVKCDEELNPPSHRDAGYLTVEIGLAPVKPAEFVVFQFTQMQGVGE